MIQYFLKKAVNSFKQKYIYDAVYLYDIAATSTSLLMKFNNFVKLSQHRKVTPVDIYYCAKLAALKVADCGPCLQLNVNFALEKNLSSELLEKIIRQPDQLSAPQKLAYDFGYSVAANSEGHDELSEKFERQFGKTALVETAMAVATTLVYPTLKRGLRHAKACHLVHVTTHKSN